MMETAALLTALAAGAFGALAYGYRGQREQFREQVVWLRRELATLRGTPPPRGDEATASRETKSTATAVTPWKGNAG